MTYRITGLSKEPYAHLFDLDDNKLAEAGAVRVIAEADRGWTCRVSLEEAKAGEKLLLVNHVSHDVTTPYRSAYAIYIREQADQPAEYIDRTPPVFEGRTISMRGFGADAMLRQVVMAEPGQHDATIRSLFADEGIAYIQAHNAAYGCFAAKVERV